MNRYAARELIAKVPDLPRSARLLYTILDEYARANGNCFLKHVTLMGHLDCSKRSLQNWLAKLAEAGFIRIERSKTGGVNRYYMAWFSETVRNEAQSVAPQGVQSVARGGAKYCAGEGSVSLLLNTSIEDIPPLPPASGGIDVLSLEGAYADCTLCPACTGERTTGRSPKRQRTCGWCSGRGFMWPPHPVYATADECLGDQWRSA